MPAEIEEPVVAYMAIQFRGMDTDSGWAPTTWGTEMSTNQEYQPTSPANNWDVLPIDSGTTKNPIKGPPSIKAYSPLRTLQWSVKREYDGSATSGGPATAVTGEGSEIFLQRSVDQLSPNLMEYSFTGMMLANVHLVYPVLTAEKTASYLTWIRLTDSIITGYYYDTKAEESDAGGVATVDHYETLTIWYSTIVFQSYNNISKGWNQDTDSTYSDS